MAIPFNFPCLLGQEIENVRQAIQRGHISGNGSFTKQCEHLLERDLPVRRALLVTSCTHALEMCGLLLDLQPGDEVIVPAYTFVSTINAFALRGATPVFVDVRPDTLNLDEEAVARLITPRTRAIVAVHYGGVACNLDALLRLSREHDIPLVEDNAHGLYGSYRGQRLGSFGRFATLSFHETKNISCGEGGALLLNDDRDIERAEILRDKGTNRSQFFRGEVAKYTWVDIGSSYVMSDMLAAYLQVQLAGHERIQNRRREIWERYRTALEGWAEAQGIQLPFVPAECGQAYHLFYLILPSLAVREAFIAHLRHHHIHAVFHYQALNTSLMARKMGGATFVCPVTERLSDCLVRLPFYYDLNEDLQEQVIARVLEFRI